jgi:glycosyltransferase involved in cell wall biosynthesis
LDNVVFHGLQPHADVPRYLWHADVLLLPPSRHHPSARWTSPVKLGEYLASGVPVVATDIPALRDALTDDVVQFVRPDDPNDLAQSVRRLLQDDSRVRQLSQSGREMAEQLSYQRRAQTVLDHVASSGGAAAIDRRPAQGRCNVQGSRLIRKDRPTGKSWRWPVLHGTSPHDPLS